ncbi:MAG: ATP-binding cassette domain-containing protein, partial [Clostridia bacterium]|nr:ATP-binding cassette domain-containing protein [Clostridia bacterium]
LSDKKSALIIVSHDRYFLDKVCNRIWEVDNGKVYTYNGNYGAYKLQRQQRLDFEQKQYERQQKEIDKLTDYIARNKVRASTANMAKSREKQLERMEVLDAPQTQRRPPRFKFASTTQPTKEVLSVRNLTVAFGERKVLDGASLLVERNQKVALIGLNGTGKSTLLKAVYNGNCYPSNVVFGKNVSVGYYDQENVNLNANLTVLDQLWFDNTRMSQTEIRNLLAQVTLTGEAVFKKVGQLSGGERAKLGLAVLMAKDNNFLLLDEPTNHLDLPSREALEQSLKNYEGTLLFVSHDRYFVNAVADVVVELEDGKLTAYNGNYDNFIAEKKKQMEQQAVVTPVAKPMSQPTSNYRSAKQRAEETNRKNKIKQLEKQMTDLEQLQAQLQQQMALPEVVSNYSKLSVVMEELKQVEATYEQVCLEWEQLID